MRRRREHSIAGAYMAFVGRYIGFLAFGSGATCRSLRRPVCGIPGCRVGACDTYGPGRMERNGGTRYFLTETPIEKWLDLSVPPGVASLLFCILMMGAGRSGGSRRLDCRRYKGAWEWPAGCPSPPSNPDGSRGNGERDVLDTAGGKVAP